MSKAGTFVIVTLLFAMGCSEWIPATVDDAIGSEHVRVRERITLVGRRDEARVVATELESPSRATLMRLKREGARFEVRRPNERGILVPVALSFVGVAVLGGLAAWLFGRDRPCVALCPR